MILTGVDDTLHILIIIVVYRVVDDDDFVDNGVHIDIDVIYTM